MGGWNGRVGLMMWYHPTQEVGIDGIATELDCHAFVHHSVGEHCEATRRQPVTSPRCVNWDDFKRRSHHLALPARHHRAVKNLVPRGRVAAREVPEWRSKYRASAAQHCPGTTACPGTPALALPWYYCPGTPALALPWYYCPGTNALVLLPWYYCPGTTLVPRTSAAGSRSESSPVQPGSLGRA